MSITGFPGFDRAAGAASLLRAQLARDTAQASSGRRADSYAGLGADARRAVDLRAELNRRDELSRAAAQGEARANHTQVVLTRLTGIATEMIGRAQGLLGMGPAAATATTHTARAALQEVAGLLNESFAGEALFGGTDLHARPVPGDIEASGMVQGIATALAGMLPGDGVAVRAAVRGLAASDAPGVTPFSANAAAAAAGTIADARRSVPVEEGVAVEIGMYANRNAAAAPSTDPDSTGAWARDLLGALATLAHVGPAQAAMDGDFRQVVDGAIGALRASLGGLTEEAGALGNAQARIAAARERHEEVAHQMEMQLGAVEQVDLAEAITRMQATRTQLEASYRSLSMLGDLSLTRFLR